MLDMRQATRQDRASVWPYLIRKHRLRAEYQEQDQTGQIYSGVLATMSNSDRGERNQVVGTAFSLAFAFLLVSLIVGVLAYSQGREAEVRNQQPAAYAEGAKEAAQRACVGVDPATVFECVYEKVDASQEQAHAEQDLDAQQGMKFWAAAMGLFTFGTLVVTGLGVWYVARTLETNVGFLKESRDATKAMNRANKIAAAAQRPWIKIEAEVTCVESRDNSFVVQCTARVTNIGNMAALDCAVRGCITNQDGKPTGKYRIQEARTEAKIASRGKSQKGFKPYPLLPNETATFSSSCETIGHPIIEEIDEETKATFYVFFVAVRYRLPGEKKRRKTDRAFCVSYGSTEAERRDPFGMMGIPIPLPDDLSIETSVLRRAGHTRTT